MNLKRGEEIPCRFADIEFSSIAFDYSGDMKIKEDLALAVKLLNSIEDGEAEKVFAKIIDGQFQSAVAFWGVSMPNFNSFQV